MPSARRCGLAIALLLGLPGLSAAPPVVKALFPAGGKAGSSYLVTLSGTPGKKNLLTWADHPGIVLKPGPKPALFEVGLAADTPPGPHLVRFYTDEGSSAPRLLVVGALEEITDAEPNDDHRAPQVAPSLPVTINGKFDKAGDADSFRVTLEAGKWLVAALQAYALGSQTDPVMRLLDEQGTEVAMSHDTHNLDPLIAWQAPKNGSYTVQIMTFVHPPAADVTLKGGGDAIYRLTLTQQPYGRLAWPPGVRTGAPAKTKLLGWNFGAAMEGPEMEVTLEPGPDMAVRPLPAPGPEAVLVALNEQDSVPFATAPPPAQPEPLPPLLHGRLLQAGKADYRAFTAKKGENFAFRVTAAALHSPLDAVLTVENAQQKILALADDGKDADFDPFLAWKAPADGSYVLSISDRFQRGGWDFVYQISTRPSPPTMKATLPVHELVLTAGKSAEVKITTELQGEFQGRLVAAIEGLPPGVTVPETEVPAKKGGEVTLKLTASPEVSSSSQPVEVVIRTTAPDAPAVFRARFDLRGEEPRGDRLINSDSRVWLTVQGKSPAPAPVTTAR